ncbi:MAG: bifunctional diaminohydroxyphosphoribosylaminopyrimidine deaminase/5-amino-6-(5-phosphoribosylamino)uracil reductase RibD [bacterium]
MLQVLNVTDEELIKKTLKLAEKGRGQVSPNPMVGAFFLKDNEIVGQGFHQVYGGEHAEIIALNQGGDRVEGSTLYVNLEPCSHSGKQPPCVDRILESGIKRVVIGTQDPNPLVNGKGIELLRNSGIDVRVGVLENECRALNEAYFKHVVTGLPLTTLKIAQTLDGKIATNAGNSQWITSKQARRYVHKMRSKHDAVLVGIGTVLSDDPNLTVRLVKGVNPKRVVLDSNLRISLNARLLSGPLAYKTIIATTLNASWEKIKSIEERGATVWVIESNSEGRVDLATLWKKLGQEGIASVLVEGGSQVFSACLKSKLVDKIAVFIAPKILGDGLSAVQHLEIESLDHSINLIDFRKEQIGDDVLLSGRLMTREI